MDVAELKRIKGVVMECDGLIQEISKLSEIHAEGKSVVAVEFVFFPKFEIRYASKNAQDKFLPVCSSYILKDCAEEFRKAFLAIVERKLQERREKLEGIGV